MDEVNNTQKKPVKPTEKKSGVKPVNFLTRVGLFLILAISLSGLFYYLWQQQKAFENLLSAQTQLASENENLRAQLQIYQQELENIINSDASSEIFLNQQIARLDSLNEELVSLRLGLNANQATGIWQLAEAASMLRLAQQYLSLMQDVPVALNLYLSTDAILAQIDDPVIDQIRGLLASDIRVLRNSTRVDVEGLYLRLSNLSQQLENVSVGSIIEPSAEFLDDPAATGDEGFFANIRAVLSRYFTVRRLDTPVVLPLDNQQSLLLRQNMQLQLEQAKLALLQKRAPIYHESISAVLMLAQQFIPEQDRQKAFIIRNLREFQVEPILLDLPSLSESLMLLENLLDDPGFESRN